jgi:hypothetical protein
MVHRSRILVIDAATEGCIRAGLELRDGATRASRSAVSSVETAVERLI